MSVQKKLRFGQAKDPKVIDEDLINGELIASGEKLNYTEVKTLSLSDKNIMEIQNLDGLDNLEKLQLDNNIINSIQGLDHLTKLRWLDLSFNSITEIRGLSNLVNLTDLTLSNNRIVVVDNLKELRELVFLSLNNNFISNLGQMILGVRPLKKLKVLNCSGNPFQKTQPNYQEYIVFHLKETLKYVDSIYIDEAMKSAAHQEDKYKLEELEDKTDEIKKREDSVGDYERLNVMILYQYDLNLLNLGIHFS